MYTHPKIKSCMPVYRLSPEVFRIGAQLGVTSQFTDPKGHMWSLVSALNGSSLSTVVERVKDEQGFLDETHECTDIPARFLPNVEYYAAHPGNSSESAHLAHQKLSSAHVALLGLGGGGANIATLLAGTGIGCITIVDYDVVEESNLGRQYLYRSGDIGKVKVEVAKQALIEMNPDLDIRAVNRKITSTDDVAEIIRDADIVICALDEPPFLAQRRVNKAIIDANKPCIFGATQLTHGRVFTILPGDTGCFDCLHLYYAKNDENFVAQFKGFHEAHFNPPTIAYGPAIWQITLIMVDECIRLLTGYSKPKTIGHQFEIDYVNYSSFAHPDWPKFVECPTCGSGDYNSWSVFKYYSDGV